VNRDRTAEVARAFDANPQHVVSVEHVDELEETKLGIGNIAAGDEPASVVDDRHREGVFVGVYSGDHECHLLFDVTAGPATRKHSGAAVRCLADLAPSLYRASSPTITATGRQPSIQSLTIAGGQHKVEPSR
jgi:hypothetical protein